MTRRFPHQSPLPVPKILATPGFEKLYPELKRELLSALEKIAPDDVNAIAETLENNAEILTKFTQAFTVVLQNHYRRWNDKSLQMFGMYASEDDMVDVIVSDMGLERLTLEPGDPNAFPPIEPVVESNEQLLTRYYLAMFALATTGTRNGYRFHAMTLGAMPDMNIESPDENTVVVTYRFQSNELRGKAKDASFEQVSKNTGRVKGYILSHSDDGTASEELLAATLEYMNHPSVAQATDELSIASAQIHRWQLDAVVYIPQGPDRAVVKESVEAAAWLYGKEQHVLAGKIDRSMIDHKLLAATNSSGLRVEIISPASNINCDNSGAPYLESVNIRIEYE
ncbi:baseplate J/gp47 family protein [Vibrio diabolicus]|uniref:baseplate J/gp47 family protein n=1 Tax=Vibrio diabolicus TaxID=50719 RepID=UPI00215E7FF3|nr:baseplate J/gp47 family protein [Vibrio diabolicus]MCS0306337.1 baseplate J/gp47 family protein [Vibrio diabolicus]